MVGIDIVCLNRLKIENKKFIDLVLTALEQEEFESKKTDAAKIQYLGGRFAAKEAIFKATQDKEYLSYSVLNDQKGKPYVNNHPELELSISHDGDYAVAICLKRQSF